LIKAFSFLNPVFVYPLKALYHFKKIQNYLLQKQGVLLIASFLGRRRESTQKKEKQKNFKKHKKANFSP